MSRRDKSTYDQAIARLIHLGQNKEFHRDGHDPFDERQLAYQGYDGVVRTEMVQQSTQHDHQRARPSRKSSAAHTLPTPPAVNRQRIVQDGTPSKGSRGRLDYNSSNILLPSDSTGEMYLQSSDHQMSSPRAIISRNPILTRKDNQEVHTNITSPFFNDTRTDTTYSRPQINAEGMPVLGGTALVSVSKLPDRFRSIFAFPAFNRMQSRCFQTAYNCDDNLVVSAPTASGKTTIFELAICRLARMLNITSVKIIYIGPTKALCEERYIDWKSRFGQIGITCNLLTGDSDNYQQDILGKSQLIITTPEKWDSITRKWHDQEKLMQMVRLMLIDEVHILDDERGATVEAIVTRMKIKGQSVRFLALSATVPNSMDIAVWLGKNSRETSLPAHLEVFGDEFRPTKLQRFVVSIPRGADPNDFAFSNITSKRVPDVIKRHSSGKPIMVFCTTRESAESTAKHLAEIWQKGYQELWQGPRRIPLVKNDKLKELVVAGVAFHHARLETEDRKIIEKAYLDGEVKVICCTSTLAVGVNLPCHLVIINNTAKYTDSGLQDCSDLDITQMLGRAGRPQFGNQGIGVILTSPEKVGKYNRMIQGQQYLGSHLHTNLIEHINTEVALGTIHSLKEAKSWLANTFFYVRLKQNRDHYSTVNLPSDANLDQELEHLCITSISTLCKHKLVEAKSYNTITTTGFGELMTKHYLQFKTMVSLIEMQPGAKIKDILATLCFAEDFRGLEMRNDERVLYSTFRELTSNEHASDRRDVDSKDRQAKKIADNAEKISLIVRTALGGIDYPSDPRKPNLRLFKKQYHVEVSIVLRKMLHLVRCFTKCRQILLDGISIKYALELSRSLSAGIWDDSPLILGQLDGVGAVTVSKLRNLGIKTFDGLRNAPVEQLDRCGKTSLFGAKLIATANKVPALRITGSVLRQTIVEGRPRIHCRVEVGFLNTDIPKTFKGRQIWLCLLIMRSDGRLVVYRQIKDLQKHSELVQEIPVDLDKFGQSVICHVACEEVAGTLQTAVIHSTLPADKFPTLVDEFGDDDLGVEDFLAIESAGPQSIDKSNIEPTRCNNGRDECDHTCKDKTSCAHKCCQEGRKKPPRKSKTSKSSAANTEKINKTSERMELPASSASSTVTPQDESLEPEPIGKRQRRTLDFLSSDELDDYRPLDEIRPRKKICHEPIQQSAANTFAGTSYSSHERIISERAAYQVAKQAQMEFDEMVAQPVTNKIEQMSQEIATYQPFKGMDGLDPDFMAQFKDCCEFIE